MISATAVRERELSDYLEEWVGARYREWEEFRIVTYREKRTGIYQLKSGEELLQLLEDIMGNIEDHFAVEQNCHLIPSQFSSIPQLLQFLENFRQHIRERYFLVENNLNGAETDRIVFEIYKMCNDIDQMVTRCQNIYQTDNNIPIPYQQAQSALGNNNVKLFVELMGSLIRCVPYNIHKEKLDEGYFHTIIHVIASILGMYPNSEAQTADGRIDMVIEFPGRIFIMEFKYSKDSKDKSEEALQQIKDNNYAEPYYIKGKPIEGVGMSFSHDTRNIEYYVTERLYTPNVTIYG